MKHFDSDDESEVECLSPAQIDTQEELVYNFNTVPTHTSTNKLSQLP